MGDGPRIVVIGGGSHQWVPTLVCDAAATPSVSDAHLALVDLDAARLPRLARWVEHVAATRFVGLTVSTHTDRREALPDADFVIVCISTGGLDTMAVDLGVPERYGIRQPVGDTVGPGGISRALRNVPVMAAIAADVAELAPDAWIVNVTNPMTTLTRTISRTSDVPVVGLCHEVEIARFWLSLLLGCEARDLVPDIAGVNHLPVAVALRRRTSDGEVDALAELQALLGDEDALGEALPPWVGDLFRDDLLQPGAIGTVAWEPGAPFTKRTLAGFHAAKFELLRRTGALPMAGDRHVVEFFDDLVTPATDWGAQWGVGLTTIEQRRAQEARYVDDLDRRLAASKVDEHVSMESAMPVIDSLLGGPARVVPVNIPNDGRLLDLPTGAVIETMAVVDDTGARPQRTVELPGFWAEHLRQLVDSQELTVDAALSGERDLVVEALLTDPLSSRADRRMLVQMADELIAANAEFLPQFR